MSNAGKRLSLGPIPKSETVKLSISISLDLRDKLEAYAALYSRVNDTQLGAAALVPHMLATFVARDRAFKGMAKRGAALRQEAETTERSGGFARAKP